MVLVLLVLFIFVIIKIKPQRKNEKNTFLDRDVTLSISGIFAIIIFCSHFFSYVDKSSLNIFDKPLYLVTSYLGQLMVAPFLFYSGYGIFESYKNKGTDYANKMPRNRILKIAISFWIALLFYILLAIYFNANYSISDYALSFFGITSIGNSNWYVVVILVLYFISFLSFKFTRNDNLKKTCAINCFGGLSLIIIFIGLKAPTYWYNTIVAYCFGTIISTFKDKIEFFLFKNKANKYLALLSSSLLFAGCYILTTKVLNKNMFMYSLMVVLFLFVILSFSSIFQVKNKILLFFGKNSFWIYILQRLTMIVFNDVSVVSNNRYIYFISCLALTLIAASLMRYAFEKAWKFAFAKKGQTDEDNNIKIGILISYITLAVSIFGALIVTPKVLNALGSEQYGLYSFSTSITSWLTVISGALAASYIKFATADAKRNGDTGKTNTVYFKLFLIMAIIVVIILTIALFVMKIAGFKLSQYSDEQNDLILVLLAISGINVVLSLVLAVFSHYITYKRQFIFAQTLTLAITFITYVLNLVFALLTKSVISIAIIATVTSTLSLAITVFYCFKTQKMPFEKNKLKENSQLLKSIIIFSSFIILNTVVDRINNEVDKTILGVMVDANSVTIYTLSKTFNAYLLTLSTSISGSFVPRIHKLVEDNNKEELNELFLKVSKYQLLILCLVVGGFISCGHPFVSFWLGEERIAVYYYALPFLILDIVSLSCNTGIAVQRAMNKHKFRAVLYIVLALLNVGISVLLVYLLPKEYAIWAVTVGTIFSVVLGNWIILNIYNKKIIGLPVGRYFLNVLKHIGITAASIAPSLIVYYFVKSLIQSYLLKTIVIGLIFTLLYCVLLLVFDKKTTLPFIKKIFKKGRSQNPIS